MRRSQGMALLMLAVPCAAQAQADRLVVAICGKSHEDLKKVIDAAIAKGGQMDDIDVAAASKDELMAALYKTAQVEVPGAGEPKPWPGCDGVPAPAAASKPAAAAKQPVDMLDQMASMLFKTRDADKDGKLSQEEMKAILDQTNAKARAAGEKEVDFFKAADMDGDGFLDFEETQQFFKSQMPGAGPAASKPAGKKHAAAKGAAAASSVKPEDMPAMMFKNLDKDGDGTLSRAEMQSIIDQTNKQAANQQAGESGEDFFSSLDKSGDGVIDKEEAAAFFAGVASMMGGAGNKDEV